MESRRRRMQASSCVAFATSSSSPDMEAAEEHNAQVARLISALGEHGAGRRAVLAAVASKQGIDDRDDIEDMLHDRSDKRIHIPDGLRIAFQDIGLGHTLAPINLITSIEKEAVLMAENGKWEDIEFEVALDSGSVVHVCGPADYPGYLLQESPGSRRGQMFQMGDGGEIANMGQKQLHLSDTVAESDLCSVFQIAAVTRPLMSVGKICDEGHEITFNQVSAIVRSKDGDEICRFHREPTGGLYVAKLRLRNPAGFARQE